MVIVQARIQVEGGGMVGGGGGCGLEEEEEEGARPPLLALNSLKKSPKLVKKVLGASPRTHCAPPFSNPGFAPDGQLF